MMWMKRNKTVCGIDASMGRIRELAPQINAATDEANATVMRVEKFLNDECSVGLPESVVVGKRDSGMSLIYERIDGKYRIGLRLATTCNVSVIAWPSCERRHKAWAIVYLPVLLQKIAKHMGETVEVIEQSVGWRRMVLDVPDESRDPAKVTRKG